MELIHLLAFVLLLLRSSPGRGQFDNCPMVEQSEIGDTSAPTGSGLLAEALAFTTSNQAPTVQLLQVNVVCLAQGSVNGTYRSTSLIATYREAGGIEGITQLHLQCIAGVWSTMNFGSGATAASVPTGGSLTTALRTDCFLCSSPSLGGSPSAEQHCIGNVLYIFVL